MKKLQLLALSMLLSTPFAVTYTAQEEPTVTAEQNDSNVGRMDERAERQDGRQGLRGDKQDDRQDNHNERQARRQTRIEGYQAIKKSMQKLYENDDAVENQKAAMQKNLLDQYEVVSKKLSKLPALGDARLNASDERDMLKEKIADRKQCLEDRISMIQSWIDKKQAKIAREQASFDAKSSELNKFQAADVTSGARFEHLQSQLADIKACIEDKKAAVGTLQAKVVTTQASLQALKDSKALASEGMFASAANAVSGAAQSGVKSLKKMVS